jgi:hypothetical protein
MILTPTTFVIGAGASSPYGLPTGMQVKQRACALSQRSDMYQLILKDSSISMDTLDRFLEDLKWPSLFARR